MNLKTISGVEVKDAAAGTVEAVFSTLNTIDYDGDVTLPGAFTDGAQVKISAYGHSSWGPSRGSSSVPMLPVGKGVIRAGEKEAVLQGQFFMSTAGGRETFETVKEMGDLQEWSYGYDVLDADYGEFEGKRVRFLRSLAVAEVSPVLMGAGVGTRTISAKSLADEPKSYADDADLTLASVEAFVARSRSLADLRAQDGRDLSTANKERLQAFADALEESAANIKALLSKPDPTTEDRAAVEAEFLRFERIRSGL